MANPIHKLVAGTLISLTPFAIGLYASVVHFGGAYPSWLVWWLWISYSFLFIGELQAWWVPYLFRAEPIRAARYQSMFGATHAFLSRTQRHSTEYPARDPSLGNARHIVCFTCAHGIMSHLSGKRVYQDTAVCGSPSFPNNRLSGVRCFEPLTSVSVRAGFHLSAAQSS
jgi:hypothetical protein